MEAIDYYGATTYALCLSNFITGLKNLDIEYYEATTHALFMF